MSNNTKPKQDLVDISAVYGKMLDNLVLEKKMAPKAKKGIASGSFKVASDKAPKEASAKDDAFISKPSGPAEADGFKPVVLDTKNSKKKDDFFQTSKFSQLKEGKTPSKEINTFMKSTFDKLFEDVMSGEELSAPEDLGVTPPESEGELHGEELGDEEDIHSRLAKALELLHGIQEELEGAEQDSDEVEGDLEKEEDLDGDEELAGEATDIKEIGDKSAPLKKVGGKANVVGDETSKLEDGKEGDGKVTDKVTGNEKGREGKATPVTGKANVVSGKASNVGKYAFAPK